MIDDFQSIGNSSKNSVLNLYILEKHCEYLVSVLLDKLFNVADNFISQLVLGNRVFINNSSFTTGLVFHVEREIDLVLDDLRV